MFFNRKDKEEENKKDEAQGEVQKPENIWNLCDQIIANLQDMGNTMKRSTERINALNKMAQESLNKFPKVKPESVIKTDNRRIIATIDGMPIYAEVLS